MKIYIFEDDSQRLKGVFKKLPSASVQQETVIETTSRIVTSITEVPPNTTILSKQAWHNRLKVTYTYPTLWNTLIINNEEDFAKLLKETGMAVMWVYDRVMLVDPE